MTLSATPDDRELALAPLDQKVDHVRGSRAGRLIIEYGDYECPYSRQAFHAIEQVEQQLSGNVRFAYPARAAADPRRVGVPRPGPPADDAAAAR
jgi:hypothetical protein